MDAFDLLAGLTARLASTARLDDLVDAVLPGIVGLGFGAAWIAVLDDPTGNFSTLTDVHDGGATTAALPKLVPLDPRQPLFRERTMINVTDRASLHLVEHDRDAVPPGKLGLPRALYDHLGDRPFACGVLLGSSGEPVGALALSSYRGAQAIPDAVLSHGLLPAILSHLRIAMERAHHLARIERLDASLGKAQAAILDDGRIQAVGDLAASSAHDLKNLSGIVLLAVGVGQRSPADAIDVLPRIERANRAIGDLVARLQRIARPPSIDAEAASLAQIVEDVLILTTPILREQAIGVDLDLPAVSLVRCDAVLIHQVVLNLLINAHDALRGVARERRRIELRLRDDGGVVRLSVADNGPGIAPEVLPRLFQPFFTTKSPPHTGLGLAAARAALEKFGGQLEGRNAPSGGAVFEVTLLAAPPGTPDSSLLTRPRTAASSGPRGGRILAVDDDPDVTELIRAILEPRDFEVHTATEPAQAIEAATSQKFDLVLCDIGLRNHSGLDVCVALREAGYPGKLVLMTGWDSQALNGDPRAAGRDGMLEKPFGATELLQLIHSLLGT
jgi:signal transduction histidine kinase/CheY-like chemotaxis protein